MSERAPNAMFPLNLFGVILNADGSWTGDRHYLADFLERLTYSPQWSREETFLAAAAWAVLWAVNKDDPMSPVWIPKRAWKAAAPNVSKKLQIAKSKKKRVVSRAKATAAKGK